MDTGTHTHVYVFVFTCVCVCDSITGLSLSIYPTGITDKPGASLGACSGGPGGAAETDILYLLVGQMEPLGKEDRASPLSSWALA